MTAHELPGRTAPTATAALLLVSFLAGCGAASGGSGTSRAAESTRPSANLRAMPDWEPGDEGAETPIVPGTYLIPSSPWSRADFTVVFPPGWTVQYGHVYGKNGDEKDEFGFYAVVVDEIFTDSCTPEDQTTRAVGPGVDDLYAALREQAGGAVISKPVSTTLGGQPATRFDLRIPERLDVSSCRMGPDGLQMWYSEPADKFFVLLDDATASVYVVDAGGERQVFLAQARNATSAAERAELQAVLDSIHIRTVM